MFVEVGDEGRYERDLRCREASEKRIGSLSCTGKLVYVNVVCKVYAKRLFLPNVNHYGVMLERNSYEMLIPLTPQVLAVMKSIQTTHTQP